MILCLASPARVNQNCAHFLFISFNLRICLLFLIFFVNYDQYLAHTFTSLTPLDRFNVYRTLSTCLEQYYEQSRFILGDIRKKLNERQCACGRMTKKLDWHCVELRFLGSNGDQNEEILIRLLFGTIFCTSKIALHFYSILQWGYIPSFGILQYDRFISDS